MTTRTRFARRLALFAVLVLALGLVGMGATTTAEATGQSNHCPVESIQVRFDTKDVPGTISGFTVTATSPTIWNWIYEGDLEVLSVYVFGANQLVEVPGAAATTSGTLDTSVLGIVNDHGRPQAISHVDFCLVDAQGPETFLVVPQKVWDFGEADIPADGHVVITIDAGAAGSKSWTFDTDGHIVGDAAPLELPMGADYTVTEVVTAPEGFTCERVEPEVRAAMVDGGDAMVEMVHNRCTEDENGNGNGDIPFVPPEIPEVPEQVPDEIVEVSPADEIPEEVAGVVVEAPAAAVVEALPRTGAGSVGLTAAALATLALGWALVATARRRVLS